MRMCKMLRRKKSAETQDYLLPENCKFSRYDSGWLLDWATDVNKILIVRKDISSEFIENSFKEICYWLLENTKVTVFVEKGYISSIVSHMKDTSTLSEQRDRIETFRSAQFDPIDFIITLGGDGTLMKASAYFMSICPPIMAYNLGTLGFLSPFCFKNYITTLERSIAGNVPCILRNRLTFSIESLDDSLVMNGSGDSDTDVEHVALNEVVIDRGNTSHIISLWIEINGKLITKVNGDGLIVSTPTGSTAYSMSTGASIIHPTVRGLLITPINPFSLSMRPIFLPVGVEISIRLDPQGRSDCAHVSYDGKSRQIAISKDESINITVSRFPIISICDIDQMTDWFKGLRTGLNWNKVNEAESDIT